ncbi:MAG TPA: hypothetical protein VF017_19090 [Thermoanaerobaculia bacterium]|nr:hypothetical protein [Thermoanaerobaculia bacterium]
MGRRAWISASALLLVVSACAAHAASTIHGTSWYPIGPAPIVNGQTYPHSTRVDAGGRATVIAVNPNNPDNVYLGTATGGVWESRDGGRTWKPYSELAAAGAIGDAPLSIGALKLDDCNATECRTLYIGTGENSRRRDTYWGAGLLIGHWTSSEIPSFTWTLSGGSQFKYGSINDILLDPTTSGSSKRLYIAVSSGVTASASESTVTAPVPASGYGLFRSNDNGGSWSPLTVSGGNGNRPTDLEMDPQDPQTLYAGIDARGVFKSTNGGNSWCPLNPGIAVPGCPAAGPGLPNPTATTFDFVEVAVHRPSAASPAVLYAMLGNCTSSAILSSCQPPIYRSNDAGASWTQVVASSRDAYSRYTHVLEVHPTDPNVFFFGGLNLHRWNPAGNNLVEVGGPQIHPDHHALAFPVAGSATRMVVATDGGFYFSEDGGSCWQSGNDDLQITGFQSITASPLTTRVIGGTQDNGTNMWPGTRVWQHLTDSDSASTVIDLDSAQRMYDVAYQVDPRRTTNGAVCCNWPGITNPSLNSGDPVAFYPPITQETAGTHRLYFGTNRLYRSDNDGSAWTIVSPVLGGAGTVFPDIETTNVITAIASAPSNTNRVMVGYYDGRIFASDGACDTMGCWSEVGNAGSGLPGAPVSRITFHPTDANVAWATYSGFGTAAHVWRGQRSGGTWTWTAKASGVPSRLPVNTIHIEVNDTQRLWLGTDAGIWKSTNGGDGWSKFSNGLPNVPVYDIALDETRGRVWAGTHGRGAFVLTQPMVSNYEGWVDGGIWDVPVYGTGFLPNQNCTMRLVRQDGTNCAMGSIDADGGTIRSDASGQLTTSRGGFYIDRPVAWGCLNGDCLGAIPISACNQPGNPLTSVIVDCGGLPGISLVTGCPQQANPPTSVLGLGGTNEVPGGPAAPCAGGGGGGGGGPAAPQSGALQLLHITPSLQVGDGSSRTLCTVAVRWSPGQGSRELIEAARDAINASPTCAAAGLTAQATGLGDVLGPGVEDPAPEDPRLMLEGPSLTGSHLITSISAPPGDAHGLCFNLGRLGNPLLNQLEIVRLRFATLPGGAAGGRLRIVENGPLGICDVSVPLAAGDSATAIAVKVTEAFRGPGIPGPQPGCPSRRNMRDVHQHGNSVIAVSAFDLGICVDDANVGFWLDPEEIENRHPAADAGEDRTVEVAGPVSLDGSASTDPDSSPGTADDLVDYEWLEIPPAGPAVSLGHGTLLPVPLAPGLHRLQLRVKDKAGLVDLDEALISVAPKRQLEATIFLNQAYAHADGPEIFGIPEDGTTDYHDVAVRLSYELSPKDLVVVQLASRARGEGILEDLRDDVELDWAFYRRQLTSQINVQAGRVPVPYGLDNLLRDDGTTRTLFELPTDLYGDLGPIPEAVDGALLGVELPLGSWQAELSLWAGGWDQFVRALGFPAALEGRAEQGLGGQAWLASSAHHLRLGLGFNRFELRGAPGFFDAEDSWKTALLSAEWDPGTVFLRGELLWADHPFRYPAVGLYPDGDTRAAALQLGVRPHPKLSLLAQASATRLEASGGPPLAPELELDVNQDLALGASWAFRPEVVLKLEIHDNEGYLGEERVIDLRTAGPEDSRYVLLSLAVCVRP